MLAGVTQIARLSARLRRLRLRHDLTQEGFAEIIGFSYKFYQQIESGRKKQVWLETVERLAAGFGLEAWQLLAPEEPEQTNITRAGKPVRTADPVASRPVRPAGRPRKKARGQPTGKRQSHPSNPNTARA